MAGFIKTVVPGSIAEEMGIVPGDRLLSINKHEIEDIIDYQFYAQEDLLTLEIEKPGAEVWSMEIERDFDEDLGLIFDGVVFDKMKTCQNRCIFCFIDQLPGNMRKTLYLKDDDYRYSFLYGNFVTLTNMKERDWDKLLSMRLSPLYVSVHCMRPQLRREMMNNNNAADIESSLVRLQEADIEVHTQIVLCPGINDGEVLVETIEKLRTYYSSVNSIGIVPVGLSGHRHKLTPLRTVTVDESRKLIKMIEQYQQQYRRQIGIGFVYLADEFYIMAGVEIPPGEYYDDYVQIENGIGMARILLDEFALLEPSLPARVKAKDIFLVTGQSAVAVMEPVMKRLNNIRGLSAHIIPVSNDYFGGNVSVTGLLTGRDIIDQLGKKYEGRQIIIPEVLLKEGDDILLDDISIENIQARTGTRISLVDGTAASLIKAVLSET